jgi:hypothetical protein
MGTTMISSIDDDRWRSGKLLVELQAQFAHERQAFVLPLASGHA